MSPAVLSIEWQNQNELRAYPFTAAATLVDTTNSITIPTSFLIGLYLPVAAGMEITPDNFFLSNLTVMGAGISVTISYNDDSDSPPVVATAVISTAGFQEGTTYALGGVGTFWDSVGNVVIGLISGLQPGSYNFAPSATPLESDCIRPMIRGLSSITLVNGNDVTPALTGDITLVAGKNCQLSVDLTDDQAPVITISAIDGAGLTDDCACTGAAQTGPPITTINGISPTPNGNFVLQGSDCLTLTPITNGIQMGDTCSAPCLGCVDLENMTAQLQQLQSGNLSLTNFIFNLNQQIQLMNTTVLSSVLNDAGCTP